MYTQALLQRAIIYNIYYIAASAVYIYRLLQHTAEFYELNKLKLIYLMKGSCSFFFSFKQTKYSEH